MKKLGFSLAVSLIPLPAMAVTTVVDAGTTQTGGLVNPVQTQQVYGTANSFSVYGNQQVMRDGVTNDSNVYAGGQQNISSGGTSNGSNIQANAIQTINGTANSTTIQTGGSSSVNRNGVANNTTIDGGKLSVLSGGTASGTILNSGTESISGTDNNSIINGGIQQINRNGVANGTQINGGEQNIAVRGTVTGSIISGGLQSVYGDSIDAEIKGTGKMTVYSTGYAENTTITNGTMLVNSEAFVSDTILNGGVEDVYGYDLNSTINGGTQYIESDGQADETTIQGTGVQQIMSGGYGYNAKIYSGGNQIANTGGYAYRSNIYDGGTLTAIGEAHEATVNAGGSLIVKDNGKAISTTISGGTLTVETGGETQNTILNAGVENVYGTASGTQIKGGTQNVYGLATDTSLTSGAQNVYGTAKNTIVSGGILTVETGGETQNTILNAGVENVYGTAGGTQIKGGTQNVYGLATDTSLTSGAQNVYGIAKNTIVSGGTLTVETGGETQNTILNAGVENVYGTASGTQINSGRQNVYGLAQNTKANRGGVLNILSGGTADAATLDKAILNLQSGGRLTGTTTAADSIINIVGDNEIPNLTLDKTLVNMAKGDSYHTLNIENLNGTGIFSMNTNMSSNEADQINIQNGDGEFGLIVNDYSMDTAPNKYKIIDEKSAHENFYLIGGAVDVGAYQYKLVQESNDWYLENTDKINETTYVAKNTFSSLSSLFYTHLSPVYSRMFEKHGKGKHEGGLWVKGISRRINQDFNDGSDSQTDVYGGNIGVDYEIMEGSDYQVRLGGFTSYSKSRQEFSQAGKSEGYTKSFGLYSSLTTENQWFLDAMGAYFIHDQKINSYTPAGAIVNGKYDTHGWHASVIGGRRFELDKDWYVEPHVGLEYIWIKGVSYRTNFNTLITGSDQDNLKGSIGVTGGKKYSFSETAEAEVFGKFSLIHDWKSESKVQVADYLMKEDMSATHYKLGAGVKGVWNEQNTAFFEVSTHLGSKITMPYEITIGYQYEF